jgi:DNA-binding transcriptional regulator LsrR (DeoR family)
MDPKAIKELEILHEVSKNEHINQRHLSKKLGMAAGLVNIYLKRLTHKGYIKITGIKPRRLKYLVTPTGIAEKTRLTYEFALISYKYFKSATDDIRKELSAIAATDSAVAVVYGSGELAELCLQIIKELDIEVVGVVDDAIEGRKFQGYPVISSDLLPNLKFDKLIIAKIDAREEVLSLLKDAGIGQEKVCWLLDGSS